MDLLRWTICSPGMLMADIGGDGNGSSGMLLIGGRLTLRNTGLGDTDLLLLLLLEALVLLRAIIELPIRSEVELTKDIALLKEEMDALRELCALEVSDGFLEL